MSILYTDGGVIGKNPSEIGGTWAWVLVNDEDNEIIFQKSGVVDAVHLKGAATNNQMEFLALLMGLRTCADRGWYPDEVRSDSKVSLGRLFMGWGITNIPDWMMEIYKDVLDLYPVKPWTKIIKTKYTLLDGHPTKAQLKAGVGKRGHPVSKWNVLADELCRREAEKYMEMVHERS